MTIAEKKHAYNTSRMQQYDYLILARHGVREDSVNSEGYRGRATRPCDPDLNQPDLPELQRTADRMLQLLPSGVAAQRGVTVTTSPFRRCVQTAAIYAQAAHARSMTVEPYLCEHGLQLGAACGTHITPLAFHEQGAILHNARDAMALYGLSGVEVLFPRAAAGGDLDSAHKWQKYIHQLRAYVAAEREYADLRLRALYSIAAFKQLRHRVAHFALNQLEGGAPHLGPVRILVQHAGVCGELMQLLTGINEVLCGTYFTRMGGAVVLRRAVVDKRWVIVGSTMRDHRLITYFIVFSVSVAIIYALYHYYRSRSG